MLNLGGKQSVLWGMNLKIENNNFPSWNLASILSEWKKVQEQKKKVVVLCSHPWQNMKKMRWPSVLRNRIAPGLHSSNRWLQLFISFSVFTAFLVGWPQAILFPEATIICPCAWVSCFKTKTMGDERNARALYFYVSLQSQGVPELI